MKIFQSHRERVTMLRQTLDNAMETEMKLHGVRAKSWHIQENYTLDQAIKLKEIHNQISDLEKELTGFRQILMGVGLPERVVTPPPQQGREAGGTEETGAIPSAESEMTIEPEMAVVL